MFTWLSILMIVLGIALLFFGRRLWLLGTGIGALLGVSLVLLMPGLFGGWLGVIAIVGLAILVGILTFIFKAFGKVIAWGLGFLAGGAITMSLRAAYRMKKLVAILIVGTGLENTAN